jgi:hypothetical protein
MQKMFKGKQEDARNKKPIKDAKIGVALMNMAAMVSTCSKVNELQVFKDKEPLKCKNVTNWNKEDQLKNKFINKNLTNASFKTTIKWQQITIKRM